MVLQRRASASSSACLPLNHIQRSHSEPSRLLLNGLSRRSSSRSSFSSSSSSFTHTSSTTLPSRAWFYIATILLFLPWAQYLHSTLRLVSLKRDMYDWHESQVKMQNQLKTKQTLINAFKSKLDRLEQDNHKLVLELRKNGNLMEPDDEKYQQLETRENALLKRIDDLESHIQTNSIFAVTEEYGTGPHQVELKLAGEATKDRTIVLEMAPLQLMPHSVHHFLRMVTKGLWNGMTFVQKHGAPRVLQATPTTADSLATTMDPKFLQANLTQLTFAETSDEYLFRPYSAAFVGTPGGPGFVLSGIKNPSNGGDGESCFATVVSGRNVIDKQLAKEGGSRLIEIETVRLLTREEHVKYR